MYNLSVMEAYSVMTKPWKRKQCKGHKERAGVQKNYCLLFPFYCSEILSSFNEIISFLTSLFFLKYPLSHYHLHTHNLHFIWFVFTSSASVKWRNNLSLDQLYNLFLIDCDNLTNGSFYSNGSEQIQHWLHSYCFPVHKMTRILLVLSVVLVIS